MMKKNGIRLTIGDLVMKKTHFFTAFCGLLAALSFVSCNNETDSGDDTEKEVVVDTTAEKIALYNKLVGTSWEDEGTKDAFENYRKVSFYANSVKFNNTTYALDLQNDLFFKGEDADATKVWGSDAELVLRIGGKYFGIGGAPFTKYNWMVIYIYDNATTYKQVTSSSDSGSSGSGSGSGSSTSTTST